MNFSIFIRSFSLVLKTNLLKYQSYRLSRSLFILHPLFSNIELKECNLPCLIQIGVRCISEGMMTSVQIFSYNENIQIYNESFLPEAFFKLQQLDFELSLYDDVVFEIAKLMMKRIDLDIQLMPDQNEKIEGRIYKKVFREAITISRFIKEIRLCYIVGIVANCRNGLMIVLTKIRPFFFVAHQGLEISKDIFNYERFSFFCSLDLSKYVKLLHIFDEIFERFHHEGKWLRLNYLEFLVMNR